MISKRQRSNHEPDFLKIELKILNSTVKMYIFKIIRFIKFKNNCSDLPENMRISYLTLTKILIFALNPIVRLNL